MMWIAISPRGVSKPVIIQSGTNANREVYREMTVEARTATVYWRETSWRRISLLATPGSSTLCAWHCPVSGGGRNGHPEKGWQPAQRAPALPNRGFWGRYEAGGISRRLGGVLWSKTKRRIVMALTKIDLKVPLTMMRGVGLRVRSEDRNRPIYIVHWMTSCSERPNVSVLKIWWSSVQL